VNSSIPQTPATRGADRYIAVVAGSIMAALAVIAAAITIDPIAVRSKNHPAGMSPFS
jgi:hypothetical protein